jgi:hypothetical protein
LEIDDGDNVFVANIMNANGEVAETIKHIVYFAHAPMKAEFIKSLSVLTADGVTRPRIAVRLTDRNGKPIQHNSIGDFVVNEPYAPAVEVDAQHAAQLSGLERARPVWRVNGEEGIAYIELEPTTKQNTPNVSKHGLIRASALGQSLALQQAHLVSTN